jgi:multidrug efflux pump subunit AcrA (membrane-fusion protein)
LGEAITAYVLQVLLGLIALLAVWKDWKEYRKRSKHWGKPAQVALAAAAILVIVLSFANTYYSRASANAQRDALTTQISQLRTDARTANDGFRQSFAGLYDKFSQLQAQVQTGELLKQNATLLKQIDETKKELVATETKLNQPKATLVASFYTLDSSLVPITKTYFPRNGSTVSVQILIYNSSDVAALNGSVNVTTCKECSFASEPIGFHKVPGAIDAQRGIDFQHIFPKASMQALTVDVTVPANLDHFPISVTTFCENCAPSEQKNLWVWTNRNSR